MFLGATNSSLTGCVRRSVGWSVGWSVGLLVGLLVGRVTHSFDDPYVTPYWPTWPCLFSNDISVPKNTKTKFGQPFVMSTNQADYSQIE